MLDSSGGTLAKKSYLESRIESGQDGRKSYGHISGSSINSRKKGVMGDGIPDVLLSTASSISCSTIVQAGTLS